MKKFSEIVEQIEITKKDLEILPTGLPKIDKYLDGGFLKKELIVLGAGTGRGKSLIAGTIFYNIASAGYKCAYFSLEISNEMIASRLMGSKSNISPTRIMIKELSEYEQTEKDKAESEISVHEESMFFYDDLYELGKIVKEIKENKYDFVVLDFIQNIMTSQSDEYERLSQVALSLQKLAKSENTCILALSQLSNQIAKDKRDDVVEYKGSGSIGTVCDLGFFIEKTTSNRLLTLKLRKNRRGIPGEEFEFLINVPGGGIVEYDVNNVTNESEIPF